MRNTGTLQVTMKSDREVVLKRILDAPRRMVFEAMTKSELMRWMGPRGWELVVSEIELRVGGRWRSVLRSPEGKEMGMSGVYREIEAPERIVSTEAYDDYPGTETVNTILLDEANGKTTLPARFFIRPKKCEILWSAPEWSMERPNATTGWPNFCCSRNRAR